MVRIQIVQNPFYHDQPLVQVQRFQVHDAPRQLGFLKKMMIGMGLLILKSGAQDRKESVLRR